LAWWNGVRKNALLADQLALFVGNMIALAGFVAPYKPHWICLLAASRDTLLRTHACFGAAANSAGACHTAGSASAGFATWHLRSMTARFSAQA
jgi:hypothetical protein